MDKGSKSQAASSGALDTLVQKCLSDPEFCAQLENDPKAALQSLRLWTQEREDAVRSLQWGQLQTVAEAFGHASFAN